MIQAGSYFAPPEVNPNSMKQLLLFSILATFLLSLSSGCKDKTTLDDFTLDFGYDYFPLEVGQFREYLVDSTTYDIGPNETIIVVNSSTFVREDLTDTISDNLGRLGYKIERSERKSTEDAWVVKDVWLALVTDQQAERLEENLRFIKMIFPVRDGQVWDGNRYIDEFTTIQVAGETIEAFKSWEYEVNSVGEQSVVNNELFEDVVEIQQADNENLIELRESKEQYARGVGLIYREMRILDSQCISGCNGDPTCIGICESSPWEDIAEKGFTLKQYLLRWN
jgi:hypothetical protein